MLGVRTSKCILECSLSYILNTTTTHQLIDYVSSPTRLRLCSGCSSLPSSAVTEAFPSTSGPISAGSTTTALSVGASTSSGTLAPAAATSASPSAAVASCGRFPAARAYNAHDRKLKAFALTTRHVNDVLSHAHHERKHVYGRGVQGQIC